MHQEGGYWKAHREVKIRIVGIGNKLWGLTRNVRREGCDADQAQMITPDIEGGFVYRLSRTLG